MGIPYYMEVLGSNTTGCLITQMSPSETWLETAHGKLFKLYTAEEDISK